MAGEDADNALIKATKNGRRRMTRNQGDEESGHAGNSPEAGAGVFSRRELVQRAPLATSTLILPGWAEALGAEEPAKAKVVVVTTKAVISAE